MSDNYTKIGEQNLKKIFEHLRNDLADSVGAKQTNDTFEFPAFGKACCITQDGVFLNNEKQTGVMNILITLYALHAKPIECRLDPFKAFKDFPNSTPYIGAFSTHTEKVLIPHVEKIERKKNQIIELFNGKEASKQTTGGDFSFVIYPLPKIALCYVFYKSDEEFPAFASCLFSNNADQFMPMDGIADVGEYTTKRILEIISK